ncbi:putative dual-specificity protein kinase [Leishmania mexicana MHOM/GT/2001/U1103]|uniref:dual-specificity kinase n=1 Tax=Leishmania mexicana (strain MHOM/GT/2001/U1103) TaxID=929439 RepID=E9B419_LEIMU|nr:putative dual-specificity protein kinase [Leishmania mexicana MHOM/GT/2001/U1103]CBZ29987.1 putative dual-specificity protein kinase [Leishmania mexicana MHOM/GT/2001/U1103]
MHPEDGSGTSGAAPISASEALRSFGGCLTAYERKEIVQYETIHYVGQRCVDKRRSPTNGRNDGYDTEEGEYIFRVKDHIAYRYEVLKELGSGAFGQVFKAIDHLDSSIVAVKMIRNQRKVLQQAEQEIRMLRHVNDRDPKGLYGIVRMTDNFKFRGHTCITYELLGANLYDYLKASNFFPMTLSLIRSIAARMLVALTFLARESIIHCDLKPENILLRDSDPSVVKVVDLGSASFDVKNMCTYIQSRFYRAPEVIMEQKYDKAIDWWSFGCILCELANGNPIFPGEDEKDQLGCIMEYLGPPPQSFVEASSARRRREFFDERYKPRPRTTCTGKQRELGSRSLAKFVAVSEDDDFLSFVRLFLQWEPSKRVPPREAMKHHWICGEFVFPTQSEEKPTLSSLTKESNDSATGPLKACMSQEPAASLKTEASTPITLGQPFTARGAPADFLSPSAPHQRVQRSALLPQPPTACTDRENCDALSGDGAIPVGTVPCSRDASASTATHGAARLTGAQVQRPPAQRRQSGRLHRGRQRRSTDMADVEMPGEAITSPNHSTSLHAALDVEVSATEKRTREFIIAANGASSPSSCACGTATRATNARSHEVRLTNRVLSSEVLSPAILRSSANPIIVTSRGRNAHSPENKASLNASHSKINNGGAVGNARGGNSAGDVPTRVFELRQKYGDSKTKAGTVDPSDRGGRTIAFNSLSRWSNTAGKTQLGGHRQGNASASDTLDSRGRASPGVSTDSPRGQSRGERREYSINLDAATLPPTEVYQPAAVKGSLHVGEYMLPSELPLFSEGASSGPHDVEVAPNCSLLGAMVSEPCGKSEKSQVSLQPRGSSPPSSSGPSAVATPSLRPQYTLRHRGTQRSMLAMRDGGAAHAAARSQRAVAGAAAPVSWERPPVQPSDMPLVPPRQTLAQRSLLLQRNGAGTRGGDVVKPSTTPATQLPSLKRYSAH